MIKDQPVISIPSPCQADWNQMTPCGDGRHCKACDKIVVDFSQMNKVEIKNYFELRVGEKVCGHFKKDQVLPQRNKVQQMFLNWYRQVLTRQKNRVLKPLMLASVSAMLFLAGCSNDKKYEVNDYVDGKVDPIVEERLTGDTTYFPDSTMTEPDTLKKP